MITAGEDDHILAVGGHHAILDGWSVALLFGEVAAHYRAFTAGEVAQVMPLSLGFGDYAAWQRDALSRKFRQKRLTGGKKP